MADFDGSLGPSVDEIGGSRDSRGGKLEIPVSSPTLPKWINRVWDSAAGAHVSWESEGAAPDTSGSSYPGPGAFGVDTSDYVVEQENVT